MQDINHEIDNLRKERDDNSLKIKKLNQSILNYIKPDYEDLKFLKKKIIEEVYLLKKNQPLNLTLLDKLFEIELNKFQQNNTKPVNLSLFNKS